MYILGYNSLTEITGVPCKSKYAGSGSLRVSGNLLYHRQGRSIPRSIKGNIYKNYMQTLRYCDILGIGHSPEEISKAPKKISNYCLYMRQYQELRNFYDEKKPVAAHTYKLNKTKVRKRITALCRLEQSRQFLAFYSISFPSGIKDQIIYQIFNKWLTNCRTRYGLSTYVWVAERQGNGTLHFHLLTNNRMEIQTINRAMANSIETTVNQGLAEWGSSSRSLYNGVDVDSVQTPKKRQYETREQYRKRLKTYKRHTIHERVRWATLYMTKYMTKNDTEFMHMPSHCSRDISQLFTSMVLSDQDMEPIIRELSDDPEHYEIVHKDRMTIYVFKNIQPEKVYRKIDRLNNILYCEFHGIPPPK